MPQGIDYMQGNTRVRNHGARAFSEFQDPDTIRNPYFLELEGANADLRTRQARADASEFAASPDRQRVDRMQRQYDNDIDLEKNAPARIDAMAGLERRKRSIEDESYFDEWAGKKRDSALDDKRELYDAQYGISARSREEAARLAADARRDSARLTADGRRDSSQYAALPRVRDQNLNPDTNEVLPGNEAKVGAIDSMLGIEQTKPFPRSKLGRLADVKFGGDIRAAEEALSSGGYYLDDDQ